MRRGKPSYTKLPAVPPEVVPRLTAVLAVLSGIKTVTAAARELGLSRNRFQSLMHRSIEALVAALTVQPAGRPARPAAERRLQAESARLERENMRLRNRLEMNARLMDVMGGVLTGRIRATGRQRRRRSLAGPRRDGGEESEPDARRREVLAAVAAMRRLKLPDAQAARVAGIGEATARRWRRHLPKRAQRRHPPEAAVRRQAIERVRLLHGAIGAAALGHAFTGLSRRSAAALKAEVLTALERERKAQLVRVSVSAPDIVRGLDAMQLPGGGGTRYALIAGDGAIPYRTSVTSGRRYDTALVLRALEHDLDCAGTPLVYRLDRARCHDTRPVRELLAAHRVLVLHGPPHHPGYYGQLERQNREHRAWVERAPADGAPLEARLPTMIDRLNRLWPRRSLGWTTAAAVWRARPPLNIDHIALHEEVMDRAMRIARTLNVRGQPADLVERLAIEQTLARMGYLRQEVGGWC